MLLYQSLPKTEASELSYNSIIRGKQNCHAYNC